MLKQSSLQTASVKCARIAPPANILLHVASAEHTADIRTVQPHMNKNALPVPLPSQVYLEGFLGPKRGPKRPSWGPRFLIDFGVGFGIDLGGASWGPSWPPKRPQNRENRKKMGLRSHIAPGAIFGTILVPKVGPWNLKNRALPAAGGVFFHFFRFRIWGAFWTPTWGHFGPTWVPKRS